MTGDERRPSAPGTPRERELTDPVDLCDERGRLNPAARGWSRQPVQRANLSGSPGRKKQWDYWAVIAPDLYLALTYADVDYLGLAGLWLVQPSTGIEVQVDRMVPFAPRFELSPVIGEGSVSCRIAGFELRFDEMPTATLLHASCDRTSAGPVRVDLSVERPVDHESLNVVIPWSDRRFQFTSKANTRRVTGTVRIGDQQIVLDTATEATTAYAALDAGRGLWKYSNRWNWASASGRSTDGRLVGLQFGGKWTVGTGYTESGLCLDGRLHKLHDELVWDYDWDRPLDPWRVTAPDGRADLVLTPNHDRYSNVNIGVLAMEVHQCFGTWSGTVRGDDGEPVVLDGIRGFAEEARNRW